MAKRKVRITRKIPIRAAPRPSPSEPGQNIPPVSAPDSKGKTKQPPVGKKYSPSSPAVQTLSSAIQKPFSVAGDAAKGSLRYGGEKIHQKFHGAVSEAEQDNAALEVAHKAERIGESIVRKGLQKGAQMTRNSLKKMGDAGKKKNRNISKRPAADLGKARAETVAKETVDLADRAPAAAPRPKEIPGQSRGSPLPPTTGVLVFVKKAENMPEKSVLRFDAPEKAESKSALRFSTPHQAPRPPSSFKTVMAAPAAQLGASVDFAPKQPGALARGFHKGIESGKRGLRLGHEKAAMHIRGKIEQESGDNSAVKALDEAEQLAERPTKYVLKKGTNTAVQPVKTVANKARNAVRHRYLVYKKTFLAKHKSIAQARGVVMKTRAIVKEVVLKSKPVMTLLAACLMIYFVCSMVVGPITAILSQAGAEYLITTTYPVANEDITGSTVQWTALEVALQQRIDDIETEFPGFDEYRLDIDPMEHDPFELMAYLAAMHMEFTHPEVQAEIEALFHEVNGLQLVEETETRYDAAGNPYEWNILNVILKPQPFEDVIIPKLEAANAKELYDIFMGSGGNQQAFGNPFTFHWTNNISCYYGNRKNPTGEGYEFHTGLDIAAPADTPIRSVQDGTVVVSGWHDLYGNYMVIRNEANITTLYAHCSALYASVGDVVRQGQMIAAVGSTGNSTGNHLHLEIKLNGERVNPLFYIQAYNE